MPLKPSDLARLAELDTAWDLSLDDTARAQVDAFADFLATDGVMAGGIGPTEPDRIFDRPGNGPKSRLMQNIVDPRHG